ncbi:MAG TPA: RNA methyltransferase [Acidimicrobiia bacterium]|nr:RNA methyltransferase [Acidimicrobiia bacterium]
MASAGIGRSLEGVHAVTAALRAGRVESLTVERGRADKDDIAALIAEATALGVEVRTVDDVRTIAETTAPQGVVATCRPLVLRSLEELVADSSPASLLVVDHVEDPHNLGAIARSAVAAGIPRLAVPDRRTARIGAAAFKAAAGAFEQLSLSVIGSVPDALRKLSSLGVWTVGLDAGGDQSLFGLGLLTEPVAIVVGAETGLAHLVRERVDVVASIPMAAGSESLNASVAAALACFEVMRVRASNT